MTVTEDKQFSRDYLDPDQRSIANAVQVFFADGTKTARIEVPFPIGHRRQRKESIPILQQKAARTRCALWKIKSGETYTLFHRSCET